MPSLHFGPIDRAMHHPKICLIHPALTSNGRRRGGQTIPMTLLSHIPIGVQGCQSTEQPFGHAAIEATRHLAAWVPMGDRGHAMRHEEHLFVRGARTVALAATVLSTYLFFLGGGFTTIAFLPPWLRALSAWVPMRYAIDGMRQALFYPTLDGVSHDLQMLWGTAVVTVVLGAVFIRHAWARVSG